jgi:uncharacterized protein Usg
MPGEFECMFRGGSLLTAEILYYRPDHPSLLQSFSWQTTDEAPRFPRLAAFLEHWRTEVEAMVHSIRVAHADWIGPSEFRSVDHLIKLN